MSQFKKRFYTFNLKLYSDPFNIFHSIAIQKCDGICLNMNVLYSESFNSPDALFNVMIFEPNSFCKDLLIDLKWFYWLDPYRFRSWIFEYVVDYIMCVHINFHFSI